MVNKADLIKWVRKAVEVGRNGVVANAFKIIHASVGNSGTEVEEWSRPFGEIGDLAQQMIDTINRDSEGMEEHTVTYHILPFFGESTKPLGRYPVKIDNINYNDPETSSLLPQEGAHPKGLLAQNQRHLEGLWKLTAGSIHEAMRRLSEENASLREQVKSMGDMHLQMVQMREDLLDRKQERQIKAERAASAEHMKTMLIQQLLPFLPIVVNKIQGKRVLPEAIHPDVEQFKVFLSGIKEDELGVLVQTFGPRLAPLMDLAIKYKKEYEDKAKAHSDRASELMPSMPGPGPLPGFPAPRGLGS
jgi:hypothetical protein